MRRSQKVRITQVNISKIFENKKGREMNRRPFFKICFVIMKTAGVSNPCRFLSIEPVSATEKWS